MTTQTLTVRIVKLRFIGQEVGGLQMLSLAGLIRSWITRFGDVYSKEKPAS